jgi:hypothetical protein
MRVELHSASALAWSHVVVCPALAVQPHLLWAEAHSVLGGFLMVVRGGKQLAPWPART